MKITAFILPVMLIFLVGCTQQPAKVRVHHYGTGGGSLGVHTITKGQNLWYIAKLYHIDLRDLLDLNNLHAPYNIGVGTRLKIPPPRTYKIKNDDNLYTVSRLFNTTTTQLAKINDLQAPYILKQGQVIFIPMGNMFVNIKPNIFSSSPVIKKNKIFPEKILVDNDNEFMRPVNGGRIISSFGKHADGLYNDGINYAVRRGAAVSAAKSGEIVYAGDDIDGYGNLMLIKHGNGYVTAYAHLDKMLGKKGDVVRRGQVIGRAGTTGHVNTPQLHFELRQNGNVINPTNLF